MSADPALGHARAAQLLCSTSGLHGAHNIAVAEQVCVDRVALLDVASSGRGGSVNTCTIISQRRGLVGAPNGSHAERRAVAPSPALQRGWRRARARTWREEARLGSEPISGLDQQLVGHGLPSMPFGFDDVKRGVGQRLREAPSHAER